MGVGYRVGCRGVLAEGGARAGSREEGPEIQACRRGLGWMGAVGMEREVCVKTR